MDSLVWLWQDCSTVFYLFGVFMAFTGVCGAVIWRYFP